MMMMMMMMMTMMMMMMTKYDVGDDDYCYHYDDNGDSHEENELNHKYHDADDNFDGYNVMMILMLMVLWLSIMRRMVYVDMLDPHCPGPTLHTKVQSCLWNRVCSRKSTYMTHIQVQYMSTYYKFIPAMQNIYTHVFISKKRCVV